MKSNSIRCQALLLLSLLATGCALETSTDDSRVDQDGFASSYAAVEAGQCTPDCTNRVCGLDPVCGVSCGECASGQSCDATVGQCKAACVPDCGGRTCGVDPVCGVSCGVCGAGSACNDSGMCQAQPSEPPPTHSCHKGFWFMRRHHHHKR